MNLKTTTSSNNKERYTRKLTIVEEEEEEDNSTLVRLDEINKLKGHSKRNFWLDYPEEEFVRDHNPSGLLEISEFKVKFAQHRELFFRENEKEIQSLVEKKTLEFELDLSNGDCIIRTTNKSFDPFVIVKGKLFIRLLCRGFDVSKASQVLFDDNCFCDIIPIKMICKKNNNELFKKRRKRIYGPNGSTLKAIELLTKTSIVIMGGTVSVVGSMEGCREVRKIVEECVAFNIHPIFRIKQLIVIQKLKNDPQKKNENWDKYLPKISKRKTSRKKKKKDLKRKRRTHFIPNPQNSKVDNLLNSGQYYFLEDDDQEELNRIKKKRKLD